MEGKEGLHLDKSASKFGGVKAKPFKIAPFVNPSGEKVWQVYGRIDGRRIRKNFADQLNPDGSRVSGKVLAKAFRDLKEVERLNGFQDVRTVATRLSGAQIQEAERAFSDLKETGQSLAYAISFFKKYYTRPIVDITTAEAVSQYNRSREQDAENGLISEAQAKRVKVELERFSRAFSGRRLSEIATPDLEGFLKGEVPTALKTWNNRRGVLSTFYRFAVREGWLEVNPVEGIAHHGRRAIGRTKGDAETLTAEQARELMAFLENFKEGKLVNFFAVSLFAGIRPDFRAGEIAKLRPQHFDLDHGQINLPAKISKIGESRCITIQPNLKAWLEAYPFETFPIIPPNLKKLRLEVRKKFNLGHDVLRHTYCSFLYSQSKDLGDVARQAGNSADMIRSHYVNFKAAEEVRDFWAIWPVASQVH